MDTHRAILREAGTVAAAYCPTGASPTSRHERPATSAMIAPTED